tara:strand:- start:249 stop:647 length:399 start_codon:yes stop_codon:yes gene_type:complete
MQEYYLSGYYEAVWFFGGALIFGTLMRIFSIVKSHKLIKATVLQCIFLMTTTLEDLELTLKLKYDSLRESENIDEEIITLTKQVDRKFVEDWKETSIKQIKDIFPDAFKAGVLEFDTWDEAVGSLQEYVTKK